jgi:hypothetical protein
MGQFGCKWVEKHPPEQLVIRIEFRTESTTPFLAPFSGRRRALRRLAARGGSGSDLNKRRRIYDLTNVGSLEREVLAAYAIR